MTSVYLFAAVLAVLAVCVIVASAREGEPTDPEGEGAPPGERRQAAVEALREIEFEYRTGKLDEEDYRELRERYAAAAVRARREEAAEGERAAPEAAPEVTSEAAASGGSDETDRSCPSCASPARSGARYCARCGEPLPGAGRSRGDDS